MSVLLPWSANAHAKAMPKDGEFAGRGPIRGGPDIHLMCRRTGRPTVLLVAGLRNRADTRSTPADKGNKRTMLGLDQPGPARAAIERMVRAGRAGKRTTGHLGASRW